MKHDLHNQIYKCRLCGKTFCPVTTDGCDTAMSNMVNLAGRSNGGKDKYKPLSPLLYEIHCCSNSDGESTGFGLADFLGYERAEVDD